MNVPLSQTLSNLREIATDLRAYYRGIKKAQIELSASGVEYPEHLKRSLFHLEMMLDEVTLDLEKLTK